MKHIADGDLHAYLDGAQEHVQAAGGADGLERHLAECAACRARLETERRVRESAISILADIAPVTAEPPPFARLAGHPRPDERRPAVARARSLAWAATVVLALGTGWIAREVLRSPAESREMEMAAVGAAQLGAEAAGPVSSARGGAAPAMRAVAASRTSTRTAPAEAGDRPRLDTSAQRSAADEPARVATALDIRSEDRARAERRGGGAETAPAAAIADAPSPASHRADTPIPAAPASASAAVASRSAPEGAQRSTVEPASMSARYAAPRSAPDPAPASAVPPASASARDAAPTSASDPAPASAVKPAPPVAAASSPAPEAARRSTVESAPTSTPDAVPTPHPDPASAVEPAPFTLAPRREIVVTGVAADTAQLPWRAVSMSDAEDALGRPVLRLSPLPISAVLLGGSDAHPVVRVIQRLADGTAVSLEQWRDVAGKVADSTRAAPAGAPRETTASEADGESRVSLRSGDLTVEAVAPIPLSRLRSLLAQLRAR